MKKIQIFSLCLALLMMFSVFPAVPVAAESYTVYLQSDSRWGSYSYGYYDAAATQPATISSSGCGLLALVNAVYYMQNSFIDPTFLADYSVNNGYRINGTGTSHSLYSGFCSDYGSTYGVSYVGKTTNWSTIASHLSGSGVAIFSVVGHLLAVVDYDASAGKYLVLDSAPSSSRGTDADGTWLTQSQFTGKMATKSMIMLEPHADYTPPTTPSTGTEIWTVTTSGSTLRMRSEPSTSGTQVGSIPNGTSVEITEIQNNWGKTTYNGVTGWISLDYATYVSGSLESGITGSGTASAPYLIDSAADLVELANNCNVGGETYERTYFLQTADINLAGSSFTTIKQFNGIYDGGGYTISGLTMTGNDSSVWPNFGSGIGLFGMVDGGTLRGINIDTFNLTGTSLGGGGGALVSHVTNATIYNCHAKNVTADLSGGDGTAGGGILVGKVDYATSIDQCSVIDSTLTSKGSGWMAGTGALVGATAQVENDENGNEREPNTISNCYVRNCSVTNTMTGASEEVNTGLILGFARQGASVTNCWATGTVTAAGTGVGVIGKQLTEFTRGVFALSGSFAGAANYVGRMIGVAGDAYTIPELSNLYAVETVTMNGQTMLQHFGGNASLLETGATTTNRYGKNITAAQALQASTYTGAGWSTNIWYFDGQNYPELRVKLGVSSGSGSGTPEAPYLICTAKDLIELATNCNGGQTYENTYFHQVADINVAGTAFTTILNFNGIYDGGGYTISGLTQTANSSSTWPNFGAGIGVFGIVNGGTVKNLNIENFNLTASSFGAGAGALICQATNATIYNCHAKNITADFSGGDGTASGGILVGKMNYGTTVDQCSVIDSTLTSKGSDWMAGTGVLVGATESVSGSNGTNAISNCYVKNCSVTNTIADASAEVDTGLILGNGRQGVTVTNCWASGTVTATGRGVGVIGKQLTDSVSGVFAVSGALTGAADYVGRVIGVAGDAYTAPTMSNLYAVETVTMNGQTMLQFFGGDASLLASGATTANRYGKNITAAAALQRATYTAAGWSTTVWAFDGTNPPELRIKVGNVGGTGSGTEEDPYLVASADNLIQIANDCNNNGETYENTYFLQIADIGLTGTGFTTILNFNGIYDGGGYTISGLTQTANSSSTWPSFGAGIGLFGIVNGGALKNIFIDDFDLTASSFGAGAGALACHVNNATIYNCHASNITADFSGGDGTAAGGILIGKIDCGTTVDQCSVTNSTLVSKGSGWMAGTGALVGATESVTGNNGTNAISNCYVKNCSVTNTIADSSAEVDTGLILGNGRQGVTVTNCWASGTVTATGTGAGVIGKQLTDSVSGVFALGGSFTGAANYVGRVIGVTGDAYTTPTLSNLYAVETVTMNGQTMLQFFGGDTSLLASGAVATNRYGQNITAANAVSMLTYTNAGWSTDIWYFDGSNYPELRSKVPGLPINVAPSSNAG